MTGSGNAQQEQPVAAAADTLSQTPGLMVPSPLEAVADLRASAKWILAALAGVGAAMLGGGPLVAVGKIHSFGHAVAAYAGLVLALAGIGWAIWQTTEAFMPPLTTRHSLETSPLLADLREKIAAEPESFYGPFGTSVGELLTQAAFHATVARNLQRLAAVEQSEARKAVALAKLDEAHAASAAIRLRLKTVLELAHAWQVRGQLRTARLHAFAGAALAVLGAVIFLSAAS